MFFTFTTMFLCSYNDSKTSDVINFSATAVSPLAQLCGLNLDTERESKTSVTDEIDNQQTLTNL